jgi:threonine/homoserine/homoserine lactone efflux protein
MHFTTADPLLAYGAFVIGVASPGPSVLAVMGMAMAQGRARALVLASGVVSGSLFWGLCAALGLAALMQRYAAALVLVKALGGVYLLWMACQAARKALRCTQADPHADPHADPRADTGPAPAYARLYLRGAALHLTNPKAIVVWLSVVSLAMPAGAAAPDALAFVASCVPLSAAIFACYALAFSTSPARRAYRAGERSVNAVLAGVFGYAGLRMLLSTSTTTRP